MKTVIPLWKLKGTFKGEPYEQHSSDIRYMQSLQTYILRNNGTGLIVRVS